MELDQVTIGEYLIQRLYEHGLRHAFGIPGDYVLAFYKQLYDSKIKVINTCDEQAAGYAANAYARVRGLGVVCITYGVGGLKVVNTTAQAYAEESPVVVISGAPGLREQLNDPLLHHKSKNFDTQLKIFEQLTVAQTVLDNPETACAEIDRVLGAAICYRRPVYIEIPRDMVSVKVTPVEEKLQLPDVDKGPFKEALLEAVEMINRAERPVLVAGVELLRYGMQNAFRKLVEKTNIPVTSTILGKSAFGEREPLYLGMYEGGLSREAGAPICGGQRLPDPVGRAADRPRPGDFYRESRSRQFNLFHQRKDLHPLPYVQRGLSEWLPPGTPEGGYPAQAGPGNPSCGCL